MAETKGEFNRVVQATLGGRVESEAIDDEVEGRCGGVGFNFDNPVFLSNS